MEKDEIYKKKVKESFEKKVKKDTFSFGDAILRWDAWKDEKGRHGKLDNLWLVPFTITKIFLNNTFVLQNLNGDEVAGPVNWWLLKYLQTYWMEIFIFIVDTITIYAYTTPSQ